MAKKQEGPNRLQELKTSIREKAVKPLYFFHGEETFLLHHYLQQIKKLLIDELTESFNFHRITEENFSLQSLANAVENLPMMAEHTLVWVEDIDIFKLAESDREKLISVLTDIPDYCTLVFTYVTTAWRPDKRLKKLWEAIDQHGMVVEFPKQEQRDLIPWVTRHFAAAQKRITPELCVYLIDITGGTMTALSGEISKICAYSGAQDICKADIDAVTEPVLDAVVFQMTDLLGQKDYGPALVKLRQLLKMKQEPIAILGAVGGHFRRLAAARTLLDCGKQSGELARLYAPMGDYAARKNMSAAAKFSPRFYAKAAELVLETDNAMKTSYDDPQRLLEVLVIQLAREAQDG